MTRHYARTLSPLFALLSTVCMAGLARAEDSDAFSAIDIHQSGSGPVSADSLTEAEKVAGDASALSLAVGNAASASSAASGLSVSGSQDHDGDVSATATTKVDKASGVVSANGTAQGNSLTSDTFGYANTTNVSQSGAGSVAASSAIDGGTGIGAAASTSSATINSVASYSLNAPNTLRADQTSSGTVSATSTAHVCCTPGTLVTSAVAAANSAKLSGETSNAMSFVRQYSVGGPVMGSADAVAHYAETVGVASVAVANTNSVENLWGYAEAHSGQTNEADVRAETYVTLFDVGTAASGTSLATGNSFSAANVGADMGVAFSQTNDAESVAAFSRMDATSTSNANMSLTSTAFGNSAAASVCATCASADLSLNGTGVQSNSSAVTASSFGSYGTSGSVSTAATAMGNAASFHVVRKP